MLNYHELSRKNICCKLLFFLVVVDFFVKESVKVISGAVKFLVVINGNEHFLSVLDNRLKYCVLKELAVGFFASHIRKDGATLVAELYREPSIDLRAVAHETIGYGELEHCDVLVICHPTKDDFTRYIRAFAENGGRIVLFGSEKELATAPADLPHVVKCRDAGAVKKALFF